MHGASITYLEEVEADALGEALEDGGITGMVGSHLADHLIAQTDWDIVGLCRWRSPLDNLRAHAPGNALTGPVVRGDEAAVRRHVQALEGLPADVAAAYRALASRAVHLAQSQRGLPASTAASILRDLRS